MKLAGEYYKAFFENNISDFVSFKLKRLKILIGWVSSETENMERNFIKFLVTQTQSLQSLHIDVCSHNFIELTFNNMPVLTSLLIHRICSTNNLRLNENIVDLGVYECNGNDRNYSTASARTSQCAFLTGKSDWWWTNMAIFVDQCGLQEERSRKKWTFVYCFKRIVYYYVFIENYQGIKLVCSIIFPYTCLTFSSIYNFYCKEPKKKVQTVSLA